MLCRVNTQHIAKLKMRKSEVLLVPLLFMHPASGGHMSELLLPNCSKSKKLRRQTEISKNGYIDYDTVIKYYKALKKEKN